MRCPSCHHEPPSGSSFCNRCGSPLADVPMFGERRQLTVMFCDMVGSTELAEGIDADELAVLVGEYQNTCTRVVRAFDGHVAQYLGDGLLVYFGYPRAFEDDAVRAVNAALKILEAVDAFNRERSGRVPPIAVRVGIHSGPVVLSDMGRGGDETQRIGVGDTLNITARLQAHAGAGEIVISDATRSLVQGAFELKDLGPADLKGVRRPVRTWRVVAAGARQGRFERSLHVGLTPLVGREQEIALTLERWDLAADGQGQTVLLSGEPGIGKSRLVAVVQERVPGPHTWLDCRCSPYHENSAFHPVIQMLERVAEIEDVASESQRRARLDEALRGAGVSPDHLEPLLDLVSGPGHRRESPLPLQGEDARARTLEALAACLVQLSRDRPIVLVVEDLHWIDPSTLELIGLLIARVAAERVLLLLTFRPEFPVPWQPGPNLARIGLHPLTRDQIATLCRAVAGGRNLPAGVLAEIVARADGVPLFAEELTKAVLETELPEERGDWRGLDGRPRALAIPSTLRESLMARLDGLGSTKDLAQLCAVIGRDVSADLLLAVATRPKDALEAGLDRLVAASLLAREGTASAPHYSFRHALIHETAYDSLLRSERQRLHASIARVLEERFPERVASRPEDLARHHELAGSFEKAVRCYHHAARNAIERPAHAEAIGHLKKAIDLIGRLDSGPARDRDELELQMALGTSTMIAKGQGHPEVESAHERARELSRRVADQNGLFRALWGLSRAHQSQGRLGSAYELGEQMLDLARRAGDPSLHRWAHLALGQALFWRGEPARALEELEATVSACEDAPLGSEVLVFGQDAALTSRALVGPTLWLLGRPDSAVEQSRAACEAARGAGDPFTHAMVLTFGATVHQLRGEREPTRALAEQVIELAGELGFPLFMGFGHVMRGWAVTEKPDDEAGVDEMREGFEHVRDAGTGLGGPYFLSIFSQAQRIVARERESLETLEMALALAKRQESHFCDADLLRMKGELRARLDPGAVGESEGLLRRAVETARKQQAASYELRAAMSLARLLAERGQPGAGLDFVREALGRVREGSQTRDVVEARALLSERD